MEDSGKLIKKPMKRANVTDEEKGAIKALLRLKIYSCSDIGSMVGRSADVVERIAKKNNLPLLGNTRKSEEYKQKLACMFGDLSEKMLKNLALEDDKTLRKSSIAQRAMVAGIAADKMLALSKLPEEEQREQMVQLSWVQLVQQTTPGRSKDGTDAPAVPVQAAPHEESEDVEPIVESEKNFLE